jgi:hypothetical protein
MGRLRERDYAVTIPALDRKDELGSMATAIEVFKTSMMEGDRCAKSRRPNRPSGWNAPKPSKRPSMLSRRPVRKPWGRAAIGGIDAELVGVPVGNRQ